MSNSQITSSPAFPRYDRASIAEFDNKLLALVELQQPCTLKSLHYVAASSGLLPLESKSYDLIQRRLSELRKSGKVPNSWFPELGRASDVAHLKSPKSKGKADKSEIRLEIWTQRSSYHPIIRELAHKNGIGLYDCGTTISDNFIRASSDIARMDKRPTGVLYLRDCLQSQTSTEIMGEVDISMGMRKHLGSQFLGFRKVAVNLNDVLLMDLPQVPKLRRQSAKYRASVTNPSDRWYEIESIPPTVLRSMLESAIKAHRTLGSEFNCYV